MASLMDVSLRELREFVMDRESCCAGIHPLPLLIPDILKPKSAFSL